MYFILLNQLLKNEYFGVFGIKMSVFPMGFDIPLDKEEKE
jgi:hypothetical protein